MSEQKTEQQQIEEMAKILDTTKKPCDCLTVSECLKYHPNCLGPKLTTLRCWSFYHLNS